MNRTIRSSAREIIYRVYRRCLLEYEGKTILSDLNNVYKRTAEMTGKSESTVRRVVLEGHRNNGIFSTPGKHRQGRPRKHLDYFNLCAIRQKIQYYYTVRKKAPTLRSLLPILRENLGYNGSHENLRQVLKVLGFKYMKYQSERSALIEKTHIAAKRADYLKIILNNRNLPKELRKDIIYLDESYVHQSHKIEKCWQSINVPGIKQNTSKGKCSIIIHAGSEKGFIPNTLFIFTGSNKNAEMNRTDFTKWVTEKLIPNLPPASIIVMDNAPYHSTVLNKAPTSGTKIEKIKDWLTQNQIHFDDTLRKPQLLMLVKRHKPAPKYEIDEILGLHGHTVVRLPPYHCDLNPIELIWGIVKRKIAAQNVGSVDIKEAAERAFKAITKSDWRKSCKHVVEIEKSYYQRELTLYQDIEQAVINLEDSNSTTSDSESEEGGDFVTAGCSQENMELVEHLNEGTDFEATGCSHENMGVEYLDEEFLS